MRGAFGGLCLPVRARRAALLGPASLVALTISGAVLAQEETTLPEIRVIAPAPAATAGRPSSSAPSRPASDPTVIDRDKVPSSTQTLTADDFSRSYSPSVTDALTQRVPGVSATDVQGSGFTQDLRYRGFAASPLQGTPQGIAVYMNGIRLNEAFGDTVNWDLIPSAAIDRADIWSSNPVFGLNALGGESTESADRSLAQHELRLTLQR